MCWLYILKNEDTDRYYIGSTSDLNRRLQQHRSGQTRTTRVLKTFDLVYSEKYNNIFDARLREKKVKIIQEQKVY